MLLSKTRISPVNIKQAESERMKVKLVEQQGVVSRISSGLGVEQHDRWNDELGSPTEATRK